MMPLVNRRAFNLALGASLAALAAGCSQQPPGPKAVKLGRDVCEHCNMIVSELRFAAQTWDAKRRRARVFDDFGCAVLHAAAASELDDPAHLVWGADSTADLKAQAVWLDARKASYRDGLHTPMGYGYAGGPAGAFPLAYEAALAAIRKKALCQPTSAT